MFPSALLAVFGLGGWEVVMVLAIVLILFSARHLPDVARRLGEAMIDDDTQKPSGVVYEALTHDNVTAEFIQPHKSENAVSPVILFIAQGFGIGRIPFAPGTFGSLLGLLWFVLLLATNNFWCFLGGALIGVGLSVWLCGMAEKILKQKDPSSVVLDEIIAIPFCFLPWVVSEWLRQHILPAPEFFFTDRTWLGTAAIFVLFRVFDIAKPWPVRQSQRLPGGWGVTVDDLLAAFYVALLTLFFVRSAGQ